MKHDKCLEQGQHRARLGSRGQAERATCATLEKLAERQAGGQLPLELGEHLRGQWSARGERFSLEECLRRVSQREGVDLPDAIFHARGVIEVLDEVVSKGEMEDVWAQLPAEFDRLFEIGSTGHISDAK